MKRTVQSMTNDSYDFGKTIGSLDISIESLELQLPENTVYNGSFEIHSQSGNVPEGYIYTTSGRMLVENTYFKGEQAYISYSFNSRGLKVGDESAGEIIMLTNKGEYVIDYSVKIEAPYIESSMGPIKNLFHFANLAKEKWDEAIEIYYSPDFEVILNGHDSKYKNIYRALSADPGNSQQMDEFLVAVKKKSRVHFEIEKNVISIHNPIGVINKEIVVNKTNWGNVWINVSCDEDYISFSEEYYSESDFEDNKLRIGFSVDSALLYNGNNYAKIRLETSTGEVFNVNVCVANHARDVATLSSFLRQKANVKLIKDYIDFRLGKSQIEDWIKKSYEDIEYITGTPESDILHILYQVQLLVAEGRINDAEFMIDRVKSEKDIEHCSTEIYAYYLYLTTLIKRDNSYIDKVAHKIKKLFNRNEQSAALAWIMLYLQEELYFKEDKKWEFLENRYNMGTVSAILLTETAEMVMKSPNFLVRLSEYEIKLISFVIKNECLTYELSDRIQFLLTREREFSAELLEIAIYCYEKFADKEMLSVIVTYLIRGNCIGNEYFKWYELGVKQDLRVTRLYEFYMYAMSVNFTGEIPKMVLMYFAYQNNLDHEKMAFLYEYVIRNRVKYPEIAASYQNNINAFLREQLIKERINNSLIYLYSHFVNETMVDEDIAKYVGNMLFIHEINAPTEQMINCIIVHNKVVSEKSYPVYGKKAYVSIYSKDITILWEDECGNRFVSESLIAPAPLFKNPALLDKVYSMAPNKLGIVLHMTEKSSEGGISINDDTVFNYEKLLRSDICREDFRKEILYYLLKYYYDNDNYRELDDLIKRVRPESFTANQLGEVIQIMIARGLYNDAFKLICDYGPEQVSDKFLMRLLSRIIEKNAFEENLQLVLSCRYLYSQGKYDQNILKYLELYMQDANSRYCKLYNDVVSFNVEAYTLLDRMMMQLLFTGGRLSRYYDYFEEYVALGCSETVKKAFLSQCAYNYFIMEASMEKRIYNLMMKAYYEDDITRIMRLALLKYQSELDKEEWNLQFVEAAIDTELGNGKTFPFFAKFASKVKSVLPLTDRTYVTYKGSMESKVIIHYAIEHNNGMETEYRKEEMMQLYGGLFIKDFILFSGEEIQYYITEEIYNNEQLTQSSVIKKSDELKEVDEFRYSILNSAVFAGQMDDYESAAANYYDYIQKDYLVGEIFKTC